MTEKTTGYILLTIGLTIMLFSIISVVLVFTKRATPIEVFHLKGISFDASQFAPQLPDMSNIPGVKIPVQNTPPQKIELISGDALNMSANLFVHLAFMGFLLSAGTKIAGLGVSLVRPIVVQSSQKDT